MLICSTLANDLCTVLCALICQLYPQQFLIIVMFIIANLMHLTEGAQVSWWTISLTNFTCLSLKVYCLSPSNWKLNENFARQPYCLYTVGIKLASLVFTAFRESITVQHFRTVNGWRCWRSYLTSLRSTSAAMLPLMMQGIKKYREGNSSKEILICEGEWHTFCIQ